MLTGSVSHLDERINDLDEEEGRCIKLFCILQEELLCRRLGQLHFQRTALVDRGAEGEWHGALLSSAYRVYPIKKTLPKINAHLRK